MDWSAASARRASRRPCARIRRREDVIVSLEHKLVAIATRDGHRHLGRATSPAALTDAGYDVKGITRTQRSIADIRQSFEAASDRLRIRRIRRRLRHAAREHRHAAVLRAAGGAGVVRRGRGAGRPGLRVSAAGLAVRAQGLVFGIAGVLLAVSGAMLWRARRLPCPVEPAAARSCMRLRRISAVLYFVAAGSFVVGATFAFGLAA